MPCWHRSKEVSKEVSKYSLRKIPSRFAAALKYLNIAPEVLGGCFGNGEVLIV